MARIVGLDWGAKRIGIAVTDPLQIICSPLETVDTVKIINFLKSYCVEEEVEMFVVGEPLQLDGGEATIMPKIKEFIQTLEKTFPNIPVALQDERFTSSDALQIIRQSGLRKKQQHDKRRLDRVSAALILENYLEAKRNGFRT
jgi:putative Holliday junction resolvase